METRLVELALPRIGFDPKLVQAVALVELDPVCISINQNPT